MNKTNATKGIWQKKKKDIGHMFYSHYYKRVFLRRHIYIDYKGTDVVNDTVTFL